jgi:predicted ATP-dependent serine protease
VFAAYGGEKASSGFLRKNMLKREIKVSRVYRYPEIIKTPAAISERLKRRVYNGGDWFRMPKTRVSTGVPGLDELLVGGYVKGRSTLLGGGPGRGKSILTWHFLYEGISKGENGPLVSIAGQ